MLDHLSIQCADVAASAAFYDAVLAPIGGTRGMDVMRSRTGRTTFTTRRSMGKMRSMYQRAISGSESRRSVSAVGAQSMTTQSKAP